MPFVVLRDVEALKANAQAAKAQAGANMGTFTTLPNNGGYYPGPNGPVQLRCRAKT
jgi:hypothetical protein